MSGRAGGGGARKTLLAPIHFIFKLLQQRTTVSIWLYEQLAFRIEGKIRVPFIPFLATRYQANNMRQGFDEFMNLVIDDAVEVKMATKTDEEKRRPLGMIYYHCIFDIASECYY
jgi:small nuclear ribonucleoprotein E